MRKSLIMLVIFGLLSSAAICFAGDAKSKDSVKDKKEVSSSEVKEIEGVVSAVDKNGIAVVFQKDAQKGSEEEMYIPIEKGQIRLIHKTSLKEIETGDTVIVGFQEVTDEIEGKESKRFKAAAITFLKKAEKKPEPQISSEQEEQDSQDEARVSDTAQPIPLKGFKED